MQFQLDDRTLDLQRRIRTFMDEFVYPAEEQFALELDARDDRGWRLL
ncbi:hypothetical protein [Aeromicrobium sp. PE09-221]|nr:hypothetical protein [Aeromicrobium sp. PE09-221]